MKKNGTAAVILLAFVMVSSLSWVYQQERGVSDAAGNGKNEDFAPVYRVQTDEKKVGLSFEAAWGCQGLEEILTVLAEKKAGATFFVTGEWMEKYPEQTTSILEAGMELANGGQGLSEMTGLSLRECRRGIRETEETAERLGAGPLRIFRPPLGKSDETLLKTAKAMGYTVVCWTTDTMDWKNYGAEAILQAVGGDGKPESGTVFRFRVGGKYTDRGLALILDWLFEEKFEAVPVSQLLDGTEKGGA